MAGTQFGIPPKQISELTYTGADLALVPVVEAPRPPGITDKNYPIDCLWRDTVLRILWWLSGFNSTGALWVNLSSGGAGLLSTLSDTIGTPVSPDPSSNIQLSGGTSNISIVSNPGAFRLDFSIANQVSGTAMTNGAVTADVIIFPLLLVPGTYQFSCRVAAFCSTANGGPLGAGYELVFCVRTDGVAGNTQTIVGTPEKTINEEGALSAGNVTIVAGVTVNTMVVRVLGTAAKTINWKADLTYTFVS
jgi:hypothetical protein